MVIDHFMSLHNFFDLLTILQRTTCFFLHAVGTLNYLQMYSVCFHGWECRFLYPLKKAVLPETSDLLEAVVPAIS
jgi:hypothetical protein